MRWVGRSALTAVAAISAYRGCCDLPSDVTDDELGAEAIKILKRARQGATLDSLKLDIATVLKPPRDSNIE
jgi:hypothetical protein